MSYTPAAEMDPNEVVKLRVYDKRNAGKSPNSRWGRISFDDSGYADVTVKASDIPTLDSLNWLSPEDRAKYILPPEPEPSNTELDLASLMQEVERLKQVNTHLASKNADLEMALNEARNERDLAIIRNEQAVARLMDERDTLIKQLEAATAPPAKEGKKGK